MLVNLAVDAMCESKHMDLPMITVYMRFVEKNKILMLLIVFRATKFAFQDTKILILVILVARSDHPKNNVSVEPWVMFE